VKRRILFVDDEDLVLRAIGRLLQPMSHEWEMEFVTSGAKALDRMAEAQFDVIVSDMRMPGMNGAELLNEVMKRHPRTVRFILSGFSDRELILKCVGSTHQYLSKPCDERELRMAILRATQLEETLQSEKLRELVTRCSSLPSVPEIYSELIEELQNPDADNEDMARIVLKDGGMTARILKLANSAFFGFGQEISDISQAIIYLGTETIKSLILFSNAFSEHEQLKFPGFAVESLWQHSLEAACASKRIAIHEDEERKVTEEAYVAGLLHDVGKLMLAANLPAQYQEAIAVARREKVPLSVVERKMFGADHADIGGYLLGLWGLPVPVVEAIALHHRPGTVVQKKFSPLTAVHVGNILVTPKTPAIPNLPASELDENYLAEAGLRGRVKVWQKEWLEQTV